MYSAFIVLPYGRGSWVCLHVRNAIVPQSPPQRVSSSTDTRKGQGPYSYAPHVQRLSTDCSSSSNATRVHRWPAEHAPTDPSGGTEEITEFFKACSLQRRELVAPQAGFCAALWTMRHRARCIRQAVTTQCSEINLDSFRTIISRSVQGHSDILGRTSHQPQPTAGYTRPRRRASTHHLRRFRELCAA